LIQERGTDQVELTITADRFAFRNTRSPRPMAASATKKKEEERDDSSPL
jgi:hypothetical protein